MPIILLALKSLLVAAVTLGLLRLTRRRSAAERSTIAHLGLFALVALPLVGLALPSLTITAPAPVARLAAPVAAPVAPTHDDPLPSAQAVHPETTAPAASGAAGAATLAVRYAWLVPTIALLIVTLIALWRLVGLRTRAEVMIDPAWLGALARAQRRMGFKNGTALLRSDELGSPVSWGLMRPTILLNEAAVEAPEQAEAIIAHELAHVVHLDWAKLVLARVATALFWFNPLAWVLAREAHQLREEAADDAVLAADIAGPDYAQLLIGVARHECRGALLGAHGVAPSKSSLGRRVRRVLDGSPARAPSGRSWIAGFATGMLCMAVPLAAVTIVPGKVAPVVAERAQTHLTTRTATTRDRHAVAASEGDRTLDRSIRHAVNTAVGAAVGGEMPQADEAPRTAASRDRRDIDEFMEMRAAGISDDYRRGMADAGFPGATLDELSSARAVGVTPAYARAMRETGLAEDWDDVIHARAMGADPAYITALRRLGIRGSLNDYQGMRAVDVTPAFVRGLRAKGIRTTSPDELISLRASGLADDP
jgi:beta-lactamase regulating signal transducer with metallopeptidase domain